MLEHMPFLATYWPYIVTALAALFVPGLWRKNENNSNNSSGQPSKYRTPDQGIFVLNILFISFGMLFYGHLEVATKITSKR
jgi:hypothetical protein